MSGDLRFSVSHMLDSRPVRDVFREIVPASRQHVQAINRSLSWDLVIPPSSWVQKTRLYGTVGTAYDYIIGAVWARKSLEGVFLRASVGLTDSGYPEVCGLLDQVEELVESELVTARVSEPDGCSSDFIRGLALLAQCDAVYRSAYAEPPEWALDGAAWSPRRVRRALRLAYPDSFVREIRDLYAASKEDLPWHSRRVYNPGFELDLGRAQVCADGDLLIGGTLVELKATLHGGFQSIHLFQVLCYAALDRLNGRDRIRRVALYNPRHRALWMERVDDLAEQLGAGSFARFTDWLGPKLPRFGRLALGLPEPRRSPARRRRMAGEAARLEPACS